eukprot:3956821-Pleurochrysis_carterae.AAC.1
MNKNNVLKAIVAARVWSAHACVLRVWLRKEIGLQGGSAGHARSGRQDLILFDRQRSMFKRVLEIFARASASLQAPSRKEN